MTTIEAIRARVQELLKEKKMTAYQLIYQSCMPPSTAKSILNGRSKNPRAHTITLLCSGFGITVREFYDSALFDNCSEGEDDEESEEA